MRYAGTDRDEYGPWFRVGQVDVTTTTAVVLLWVVTLVVFAIEPVDKPIQAALSLQTWEAASGELWRMVTWPWAHYPTEALVPPEKAFTLWSVISAAIFWFFGNQLERATGRNEFAVLMGAAVVTIGLAAVVIAELVGEPAVFAELQLLSLTVVLLFCAEHPKAPFFFGIPAWAIAGVIVALEVIGDVAGRDWVRLLTVIVAAGVIALVARRVGLLSDYDRIPELRRRDKKTGKPRRATRKARRKAARSGLSEVPPEATPAELRSTAPGASRRQPARAAEVPSADDVALDLLLDKISASGIDSLSAEERRELDEIQARRKRRK